MLALEPQQELVVSVEDFAYTTVRSTCSELSWQYERRYSCRRNRADRTYTIVRLA